MAFDDAQQALQSGGRCGPCWPGRFWFMAQAQLKIFAAVVALTLLAGTVVGAFYAYEKIFKPQVESKRALRQTLSSTAGRADPGRAVFDEAMDLIRNNNLEGAQEKLLQVIKIYRDSDKYQDARRVLGEMNLDRLFSRTPMPGKLEYTVAKGDLGLDPIVRQNRTTIPFVRRINNLAASVIHPGDRLILYPLDFEIQVRPNSRLLTLYQRGEFFKDYLIPEIKLAPGAKLPAATLIAFKQASVAEKAVRDSDPRYPMARKWLQTSTSPTRPGIIFCAQPKKKGDDAPNGIYLEDSDLEELCTLIRLKTPVKFLK